MKFKNFENVFEDAFDSLSNIISILLEKDKIIKRKIRFKNKFVYRKYINHNYIKDFILISPFSFAIRNIHKQISKERNLK